MVDELFLTLMVVGLVGLFMMALPAFKHHGHVHAGARRSRRSHPRVAEIGPDTRAGTGRPSWPTPVAR